MNEHPINSLMATSMSSIKDMVDVNTIIGDAITTPDGTVIIPVSKVAFGFGTGGSDYPNQKDSRQQPFGGGSGAGISINPIAFLIVNGGNIKLLQIAENVSAVEKIIELVPDIFNKITAQVEKMAEKKAAEKVTEE